LVTAGGGFPAASSAQGRYLEEHHAAYRRTLALHVVLEGISRGFSAVNIREFVLRATRLQGLVELGSLSPRAAAFLDASCTLDSTSSSPVARRRQ